MPFSLIVGGVIVASLATLFFSTLSYALRDFSRPRLAERMRRFSRLPLFESLVNHAPDLIFVTAIGRLFANILVLICVLRLFHNTRHELAIQYLLSVLITGVITLFVSVAIPNAAAKYAGETFIALCARFLLGLRWILRPAIQIMHFTDHLIRQATGAKDQVQPEQIEEEILSAVEEGAKEGIVDEQEREMIESVIEFRDTTAGEIMTPRPEIVAIELPASITDVKQIVEQSGHSRIPVFEDNLDHIVGILYARDLLHYLGLPPEQFDLRAALRPVLYVPESKPLRHLLKDFRLQKVHLAIVLDEYGGAAGLVTIEDVLEELVGDITDEHEPAEPAMLKRINDHTWEADARVHIEELNRVLGLSLPEEAGFETLGGFISTATGRIPPAGTVFDHAGTKYTVLDAEPQKVNRLRIELAPQPATATREPPA